MFGMLLILPMVLGSRITQIPVGFFATRWRKHWSEDIDCTAGNADMVRAIWVSHIKVCCDCQWPASGCSFMQEVPTWTKSWKSSMASNFKLFPVSACTRKLGVRPDRNIDSTLNRKGVSPGPCTDFHMEYHSMRRLLICFVQAL